MVPLSGHHKHRLHCRREPDGAELLQHDIQPNADDVPEPLPDRILPDGRSGWLPPVQPVSVPLLLRGPTGGVKVFLSIFVNIIFFQLIFAFIAMSLLPQGIAMVCGFLVVIALSVAAFFAQKTRGKIWRHGKPNIYWEEPLVRGTASEGRDVEEWVRDGRAPATVS